MIINLLHTLSLATAVGVTPLQFNNEQKLDQQKQFSQAEEEYFSEIYTQTGWKGKRNTIFSSEQYGQTYINTYESTTTTKVVNPAEYLMTSPITQIQTEWNSNDYTGINVTRLRDKKIYLGYRNSNNYLIRQGNLIFTKMEVNPINSNRNITLKMEYDVTINSNLLNLSIDTYGDALKVTTYVTTTKLQEDTSAYGSLNNLQNTQRYTGNLKEEIITQPQGQTWDEIIFETQISIQSMTTNYVYVWAQPCIVVEDYPSQINQIELVAGKQLINNLPQSNEMQLINMQNKNVYTTYRGVNTPIGTYEVVDVGGIAFEILGMPFTFISTAFNLTLFPNTPYQINISTLFLSIFAVIVFVFIVKLILGAINHK